LAKHSKTAHKKADLFQNRLFADFLSNDNF